MLVRICLVAFVCILQSPSQDPATTQQSDAAIDWMIKQRVAHGNLKPEQSTGLYKRLKDLTPAQLRVLVQVYEQSYGIQAPLAENLGEVVDPSEANREWLVAYRIVHDNLSETQAKEYAEKLKEMSAGELRVLRTAYEEKQTVDTRKKLQQQDKIATEQYAAAQQKLKEAEARKRFEQSKRQTALARASKERSRDEAAQWAANSARALDYYTNGAAFGGYRGYGRGYGYARGYSGYYNRNYSSKYRNGTRMW